MARAAAGKPRRAGREIHLDQIGDEDAGDVGPVRRRRDVRAENERVDQSGQLRRVSAYLRNSVASLRCVRL